MYNTVKPFYLAALKVGDFTCKFVLAPFYFGEFILHNFRQHAMPIKVGILSIFSPFNFTVLFSSQNSQNKGHANAKGFTVSPRECTFLTIFLSLVCALFLLCFTELLQIQSASLHAYSLCGRFISQSVGGRHMSGQQQTHASDVSFTA